MIWNLQPGRAQPDRSEFVTYITNQIESVCGGEMELTESQLSEIAGAVETFLEKNADGGTEDRVLMMLASRALSTLGEGRAARKLLVFGTGLVRASEWEVAGADAMWTLDLKQMTVQEGASLELVFFSALQIVLEAVAEVWDASRGQGVLGLRNVCTTAARMCRTGSDKDITAVAAEIRHACVQKLEQIRVKRDWNTIPSVMDLDM